MIISPNRSRAYTARSAKYRPATQTVVGPTSDNDITRHYVMTRHGAVARTFLPGPRTVEVVLWRPKNRFPQFQGLVSRFGPNQSRAINTAFQLVAVTDDYIDAEAALLTQRTRTRARACGQWPALILTELRKMTEQAQDTCDDCGNPVRGGACTRPELHWS